MTTHRRLHEDRLTALLAVVPTGPVGLPTKAIWRLLDCWTQRTVDVWLEELHARGAVIRVKEPISSGFRWTYRRAHPQTTPPSPIPHHPDMPDPV